MSRARASVAAVVVLAALLAMRTAAMPDRDPLPHPVERALDSALTERQHGRFARASEILLDAWVRHPDQVHLLWDLHPHVQMVTASWIRDSALAVADRLPDRWLGRCVHLLFGESVPLRVVDSMVADGSAQAATCGRVLRVIRSVRNAMSAGDTTVRRAPPGLHGSSDWFDRVTLYDEFRVDRDAATARALIIARGDGHPMRRVTAYVTAIRGLHAAGRHGDATDAEHEALALARRSGPGAEIRFTLEMSDPDVHRRPGDPASPTHVLPQYTTAAIQSLATRFDWLGQTQVDYHFGMTFQANGRQREAVEHFERGAAIADSVGDRLSSASRRARIARSLVKLGRLDEAERAFAGALDRLGDADAVVIRGEIAHDLLHLHEARGNLAAAVRSGEGFVTWTDSAGTLPTHMMAHHDLAWLYRRHGRLQDADAAFRRMVAIIDTIDIHHYWAGEYFESVGQLERAKSYYERGVTHLPERALSFSALARVEEALGNPSAAIRFASLADADTAHWGPEYAPVLPGLLARTGREAEARERYRDARRSTFEAGKHQAFARAALESAQLELRLGDLPLAATLGDSAADFAARLGVAELEVRARATAAVARARAGEHQVSLAAMDRALRRATAMNIAPLTAEMQLMRAEALRAANRRAGAMDAYATSARWLDTISSRLSADATQALFRATHERVSNGALSLIAANRDRAGWLDEYVAWSIARKSARASAPAPGARPGVARIQAALAADEALLDFRVGDPDLSVLVLTRHAARLVELPLSARALPELVATFLAPIAPRVGSRVDLAHAGFDSAAARALYAALIAPVAREIGDADRLTIVPDGVLHRLPFDALLLPDGDFVVDRFTVRYRASLLSGRAASVGTGRVLAVAPPPRLEPPGAREEIAALKTLLAGRMEVVGDRGALERRAPGASVIHFATHAEANDDHPGLARIAVGASGDGWLYASEVARWSLDSALVVLSACESAAGALAGGQGTLSLSRAFLRAGARGTLATLWPVGAPTADFMRAFHDGLLAGRPPEDALRAARLALRASHPLPLHWAAFTYTTR